MKYIARWWNSIPVGTKSILVGAHCFWIHPWFVAVAWARLYGFPTDFRLWLCFLLHDLGYWNLRAMDDAEGEKHVEWAANLMHRWFDNVIVIKGNGHRFEVSGSTQWLRFCLHHSRFRARADNMPFSKLCVADKLACALEPWWLYLPRVILSGEIHEYMAAAGQREGSKYNGEPNSKYVTMQLETGTVRGWHRAMTAYLREWCEAHKDLRPDTWTPAPTR